jgi:hypothetical protein
MMEQFADCSMAWVVNPFMFNDYLTVDELADMGIFCHWFSIVILEHTV